MTRVYIAGPVTGVDGYEQNFRDAAEKLARAGYEPVNPVAPGLIDGWEYRDYIDRGLLKLMECDAICMLDGWQHSAGAKLEARYAMICGLEQVEIKKEDEKND